MIFLKITEPYKWPITEEHLIHQTLRKRGVSRLSDCLPRSKPIGDLLEEAQSVNTDRIGLLLSIAPERPPRASQREVCTLLSERLCQLLYVHRIGLFYLVCYRTTQLYRKGWHKKLWVWPRNQEGHRRAIGIYGYGGFNLMEGPYSLLIAISLFKSVSID